MVVLLVDIQLLKLLYLCVYSQYWKPGTGHDIFIPLSHNNMFFVSIFRFIIASWYWGHLIVNNFFLKCYTIGWCNSTQIWFFLSYMLFWITSEPCYFFSSAILHDIQNTWSCNFLTWIHIHVSFCFLVPIISRIYLTRMGWNGRG